MLKIGVIGCGYWGPNLIRNFFSVKMSKVTKVADLDPRRLKFIKERYPSVELATSYKDLLKDTGIDAVVIATPVGTHFPLAKDCLESKKHVLIEKPITNKIEDAQELIELAQKQKRVLMVDHTYVFNPAVRKIKEIVKSGGLGKIYYFDSVRVNLGLFQHDVNVVWDLAPHDLSIMDFILEDEAAEISAFGACHSKNDIENMAYLNIRFQDNLIAHIHVNWLAPVKIRRILIGGSEKMLVFDDLEESEKIKVYDKGITLKEGDKEGIYKTLVELRTGDMYAPKIDWMEPLKLATEHFVNCILENSSPISDGACGLRMVKALVAAEESIKNKGRVVKI